MYSLLQLSKEHQKHHINMCGTFDLENGENHKKRTREIHSDRIYILCISRSTSS